MFILISYTSMDYFSNEIQIKNKVQSNNDWYLICLSTDKNYYATRCDKREKIGIINRTLKDIEKLKQP